VACLFNFVASEPCIAKLTHILLLTLAHTKFPKSRKPSLFSPCITKATTKHTKHNGPPKSDLPPPQRVRRPISRFCERDNRSICPFLPRPIRPRGQECTNFSRFCSYNTTSNLTRTVKTPGGKLRLLHIKKRGTNPKCGDCGSKLAGVSRFPGYIGGERGESRGSEWESGSRTFGGGEREGKGNWDDKFWGTMDNISQFSLAPSP